MEKIRVGQEIQVEFPFYRGQHVHKLDNGLKEHIEVWIPGCRSWSFDHVDTCFVADGMGRMVLTVIDIHKPGKYPERIFYTRAWIDPGGKKFGAGKLHITTTPTFKRRAAGFYYEYQLIE